jgi:hypothetical protein
MADAMSFRALAALALPLSFGACIRCSQEDDGPGYTGRGAEDALSLQGSDVIHGGGLARETEMVCDFARAGGVPSPLAILDDVLQDLLLSCGQISVHCTMIALAVYMSKAHLRGVKPTAENLTKAADDLDDLIGELHNAEIEINFDEIRCRILQMAAWVNGYEARDIPQLRDDADDSLVPPIRDYLHHVGAKRVSEIADHIQCSRASTQAVIAAHPEVFVCATGRGWVRLREEAR